MAEAFPYQELPGDSVINPHKYINPHSSTPSEKFETVCDNLMRAYFISGAVMGTLGAVGVISPDFYNNKLYNYIWNYVGAEASLPGIVNKLKSWQHDKKLGLKSTLGDKAVTGYDGLASLALTTLNTLSVVNYFGGLSGASFGPLGSLGFAISMSASFAHAAKDFATAAHLLQSPKAMLEDILRRYKEVSKKQKEYQNGKAADKEDLMKKCAAEMEKLSEQAKAFTRVKQAELEADKLGQLFADAGIRDLMLLKDKEQASQQERVLVEALLAQQKEKRDSSAVNAAGYLGATVAFGITVGFTGIGLEANDSFASLQSWGEYAFVMLAFAGTVKFCQLLKALYSVRDEHKNPRADFLNGFEPKSNLLDGPDDEFFTKNGITDTEKLKYQMAWAVSKARVLRAESSLPSTPADIKDLGKNKREARLRDDFYNGILKASTKDKLLNTAVDDFRIALNFVKPNSPINPSISPEEFGRAVEEVEKLLVNHGDSNARHFLLSVTADKAIDKDKSVNKDKPGFLANTSRLFSCASGDPKGSPTVSRTLSPVPPEKKSASLVIEYMDDPPSDDEHSREGSKGEVAGKFTSSNPELGSDDPAGFFGPGYM